MFGKTLHALADELNRLSQSRDDNSLAHDARRSADLDHNDSESQWNIVIEIRERIAQFKS